MRASPKIVAIRPLHSKCLVGFAIPRFVLTGTNSIEVVPEECEWNKQGQRNQRERLSLVANDLVHHPEGSDWRHGEKQNEKKDNWACRSSRHFYEPSRRFQYSKTKHDPEQCLHGALNPRQRIMHSARGCRNQAVTLKSVCQSVGGAKEWGSEFNSSGLDYARSV